MARQSRRSDLDPPLARAPQLDDPPAPKPRRWGRRCVVLLVLLAVGVVLAPEILSRTPLLGQLIAWGTEGMRGRVALGSASLSWFSPPSLAAVQVVDDKGRPVLTADAVTGDRSLWQLATAPQNLGRFVITRPDIHIAMLADGTTNLEQILASLVKKKDAAEPASSKSTAFDVAVEIAEGTLHVHDEPTQQVWTIEHINAVVVLPSDASSPLVADVQGVLNTPQGPRRLATQCQLKNAPSGSTTMPQGDAALTVEALPLELIGSLGRRFLPGLSLAGVAQGDLRAKFDLAAARPSGDVSGRLTVANLAVGGPVLKGDEVRLAQVDVPLHVRIDGPTVQIDQLTAECELASVSVSGTLDDFHRLTAVDGVAALAAVAAGCDGRATAKLDLARIAQAVPHVLRLHDDLEVTGGNVTFAAVTGGQVGAKRQQLELAVEGLTARRDNTLIAWPEALRAAATMADAEGGPALEQVQCTSDFLVVQGKNTPQAFQLNAQYDLAKLGERLAQFVDLGGTQLRGNGTAEGTWQRGLGGRFQVDGRATISDFALAAPGASPWTERQLVLALDAAGALNGTAVTSLDRAEAGLQSDADELSIRLIEPVADARKADAAWPLAIAGKGELASWLARVRPFAGLPSSMMADGRAALSGTVKLRLPADIEVVQSELVAQPFRLAAYGLVIDEPNLDLKAAGRFRSTEAVVTEATLVASSVQSQVRQLLWRGGANGTTEMSGDASLRADVARLWTMLGQAPTAPQAGGLQLSGMLEGTAHLELAGQTTNVAVNAVVNNFAAAQAGGAAWQEPQVKLVGTAAYDPAHDAISFDRLEITAAALRMLVAGKIAELSTSRIVDCRGEVEYDLARLTPVAQSYLGTSVGLDGRKTQRFELAGPTADPARPGITTYEQLNGAAGLGWDRAYLYGFQLGAANLDARLNQGLLRVNPTEIAVNTGKVRLAPSLRLGPGPMELAADPGMLVDHVSITPEIANERLKYVLPIMSGVAQASGQFSVALDELRMPLDNPNAGTMAGKVTVHSIDIGPSHFLQELAPVLRQPLTASLKRESVIDFKMMNGRIYHQNLEFVFPEITVKTNGSVGLDQTLQLTAELTLPAKLLNLATGNNVSYQVISMPIGGTLQKPAIDSHTLGNLMKQTIENAAQNAVQQGLEKGLNRLLGPSGAAVPQPGQLFK
jgi:hypothetical protein